MQYIWDSQGSKYWTLCPSHWSLHVHMFWNWINYHTYWDILAKKFSTFLRKMVSSQSEPQAMFFTCEKISLYNQNHNAQYIILLSKSRQNGRQTYIIYFFIYFWHTEIYCNLIVNKTIPKIWYTKLLKLCILLILR